MMLCLLAFGCVSSNQEGETALTTRNYGQPRTIFDIQVNSDLSINLLPFLLMIKLAFVMGLVLKDAIVGTLRSLLKKDSSDEDWSYYSPESYYVGGWTNDRDEEGSTGDNVNNNEFRYVGTGATTTGVDTFLETGKSVSLQFRKNMETSVIILLVNFDFMKITYINASRSHLARIAMYLLYVLTHYGTW